MNDLALRFEKRAAEGAGVTTAMLGLKEQQLQRYEATDYGSASLNEDKGGRRRPRRFRGAVTPRHHRPAYAVAGRLGKG